MMKPIVPFAFVMLLAAAAMHLSTAVAASAGARRAFAAAVNAAGTVKLTIHYKGKGTVDAKHRVWVWLFDTPDIGPGSMPIAELSLEANGTVAAFDGIEAKRVWVATAYDESGTMSGSAPPPSGSPIGILLGADGAPRSVVPGDETVVMTFDDSQRMP